MKRFVCGAAVLAAGLLLAPRTEAAPITFDSVGDTATINFSFDPAGPATLLTATADLEVAAISATSLTIYVTLENTTAQGIYDNAGLASFGFAIDPDATGVSGSTTGANDDGSDDDRFFGYNDDDIPSLGQIEVCAYAGNNCNGGPQNDLLAIGETDKFLITVTFPAGNTDASFDLDFFGVKFQTGCDNQPEGTCGSYEFYETGTNETSNNETSNNETSNNETSNVPEPALISLLGLGLAGAASRLRRRS